MTDVNDMNNTNSLNIKELQKENAILYSYLHDYQKKLSKYADTLNDLDKCSEKNLYYENLEIKKQLEKNARTINTLWECLGWLEEYRNYENSFTYRNLPKILFWFVFPSCMQHHRALKNNNFARIVSWYTKYGMKKTTALLSAIPINLAVKAKAWSEISKSHIKKNTANAGELPFVAWRVQPKAYRLKFLAFRMYENNNLVLALRLIESLPASLAFSDSENRYAQQIRNEARNCFHIL